MTVVDKFIPNQVSPSVMKKERKVDNDVQELEDHKKQKNNAQKTGSKLQPTADQLRIASLISVDNKEDPLVKQKLKEVVEATQRSPDEAYVALHDCDYDANRAVNMLLEGGPGTARWCLTSKKKKQKPTPAPKRKEEAVQEEEKQPQQQPQQDKVEEPAVWDEGEGITTAPVKPSGNLRGGFQRPRGRGGYQGRRGNTGHQQQPFRKVFTNSFYEARSRESSETRFSDSRGGKAPLIRPVDTWDPSRPVSNLISRGRAGFELDEEEYTGSLAKGLVITSSNFGGQYNSSKVSPTDYSYTNGQHRVNDSEDWTEDKTEWRGVDLVCQRKAEPPKSEWKTEEENIDEKEVSSDKDDSKASENSAEMMGEPISGKLEQPTTPSLPLTKPSLGSKAPPITASVIKAPPITIKVPVGRKPSPPPPLPPSSNPQQLLPPLPTTPPQPSEVPASDSLALPVPVPVPVPVPTQPQSAATTTPSQPVPVVSANRPPRSRRTSTNRRVPTVPVEMPAYCKDNSLEALGITFLANSLSDDEQDDKLEDNKAITELLSSEAKNQKLPVKSDYPELKENSYSADPKLCDSPVRKDSFSKSSLKSHSLRSSPLPSVNSPLPTLSSSFLPIISSCPLYASNASMSYTAPNAPVSVNMSYQQMPYTSYNAQQSSTYTTPPPPPYCQNMLSNQTYTSNSHYGSSILSNTNYPPPYTYSGMVQGHSKPHMPSSVSYTKEMESVGVYSNASTISYSGVSNSGITGLESFSKSSQGQSQSQQQQQQQQELGKSALQQGMHHMVGPQHFILPGPGQAGLAYYQQPVYYPDLQGLQKQLMNPGSYYDPLSYPGSPPPREHLAQTGYHMSEKVYHLRPDGYLTSPSPASLAAAVAQGPVDPQSQQRYTPADSRI